MAKAAKLMTIEEALTLVKEGKKADPADHAIHKLFAKHGYDHDDSTDLKTHTLHQFSKDKSEAGMLQDHLRTVGYDYGMNGMTNTKNGDTVHCKDSDDKSMVYHLTKNTPKNIKETKEELEMVDKLIAETEALDSLKPNAKPLADPPSKAEMIAKMLGAAATMKSDELTKFYTDMLAQIGHEADSTPAAAAKNKASVEMKGSAVGAYKEDVESLFAGQELDEEFKTKATVILESAVQAKLIVELARIEEETNVKLEEKIKELDEDFTKKMEAYLDTSASKWLEENKVAIESALRNEIIEGFIDGMKNLFKEHYVDIPEEKVDVIGELSEKVGELEGRLSEALTSNKELADRMTESSKGEVITSVSAGLVMTDVENFKKMTETVEFVDVEDYKTKLLAVREAHFTKKPVGNISLNETVEGTTEEVELDPMMARYVKAISMTTKR